MYKILVMREFNVKKHSFYKRFFASQQGTDVTVKEFSAFLDMRRCKDLDEIRS